MSGWIGVDFDGTLAEYHNWIGPDHAGAPIPKMVERVKRWLEQGKDVRIFTARVYPIGIMPEATGLDPEQYEETLAIALMTKRVVENWCEAVFGKKLPVTCCKDYHMYQLWDDRAVQLIPNTGETVYGRQT